MKGNLSEKISAESHGFSPGCRRPSESDVSANEIRRNATPYLVSRLDHIVSTESRNSNRNSDYALVVPAAMCTGMATTPISGERVLSLRFMATFDHFASSISRLVCLEVVEALRPARRQWAIVAVMGIESVIDVSRKAARTVKPRASSKKDPANEPIRSIVAVRSTVIWSIVEVPVRTHGSRSDVYVNGNLSLRHRCRAQKASYENCESNRADFEHDPPSFVESFPLGRSEGAA